MQKRRTALSVLVGVVALLIAAYLSPYVEGEASRTTDPGFQSASDTLTAALLAQGVPAAETEAPVMETAPAPAPVAAPAPARKAKRSSKSKPSRASKSSGAPAGYVYWKTIRAMVTAYEPGPRSCGSSADGKTSIGQNAWVMDGVATDPKAIPYGTYVIVPGIGGREVDDTGGAMRDSWRSHGRYHIDVRMPYVSHAQRWGVRYLDVKLYKKAK